MFGHARTSPPVEALIVRWGAWAVLVGAAVEGDASALLAGLVAHLGLLDPRVAVGAAWAGAFAGDFFYFELGRRAAPRALRSATYARLAPLVARLADRVGLAAIVIARFIYGTRVATMLYWGVRGTSRLRFAAVDAVATGLWAAAFVAVGWALSNSATAVLGEVHRLERRLLFGLLAALVVVGAVHGLGRRLLRR
jgi:membrane protein DedA with SNARE-associated domain